MLAFLYLCVCAITGMVLVAICVPDVRRLYLACAPSVKAIENIPSTLFVVAAGTVTGMLCVPFVNYYVILGLSYIVASDKLCMKISFMVTAAIFLWLVLTCLILVNKRRIKKEEAGEENVTRLPQYVNKPSNLIFYSFFILVTTVIAAFLMFYTYRIDRNYLLNGYSTFSDLSPHTAMVSSFGKGFNFPSEYMHFSGDGIKYHFMFYFLAGMLEYLGLPIDYALNVPSIIVMVCAMVLLGLLASLLSGRRLAFALSPVLVFLRSSLNVFIHIRDLLAEGHTPVTALTEIMSDSSWYGQTPYDEWGVWAINVYPNQRHLMLGVSVVLICVILFIPFVRRLCISAMSSGSFGGFFKAILFSRNAWLPRKDDPLSAGTVALYSCILVIVMPYFHGSCLISLLLILFGMALVSESRLLHLMVAVCAVASSFIQTAVFSGGAQNVLTMQYNPGFVLSESSKTITSSVLLNWGRYLITVTGATLVTAIVCTLILLFHDIIKKKPVYRFFLMLAFLNPLVFAFFFQVTREMLANHKFIQVSIILVDAFVAIFLANLIIVPGRKKSVVVLAADADVDADDEDDNETEETVDAEALEANIKKAEADGELPPVISEETKALEASTDKGSDDEKSGEDEGPFEVLTDSEESDDSKPEEITTGEDEKSEEKKEPEDGVKEDEEKDSRLLEKIPDERTVSMRPGSAAIAEEAAKAEEAVKETSVETEDSDDSDDAEAAFVDEKAKADDAEESEDKDSDIPSERTVGMRPGATAIAEETSKAESSDKAEEKDKTEETDKAEESSKNDESEESSEASAETEEAEDDLPFEVLDDEDGKDKKESKELTEKSSDEEDKPAEPSEAKDEGSDEESGEDDEEDMVLEHKEVETVKTTGLPGPVWFIFEIFGVLAALILLVALVGTGISEWATYININSTPMAVNVNSPLTEWIEKNTEPNDVFLTPEWSMNRFLLAGRPMYYGWPYYAWSAGHDTNTRDTIYLWLISGCGGDIKEFKRYCKERGIRYLIADPDFDDGDYGEDVFFNREFFEANLTQVAYFTEENTVIYKIY